MTIHKNKLHSNIEKLRIKASKEVEYHKQILFEQYFTPIDIANYMSNLFTPIDNIKLLDAGAGVGNLGSIASINFMEKYENNVELTAIEWDINLKKYLEENFTALKSNYKNFHYQIKLDNFYNFAIEKIKENKKYNRIILNPPYSKTSNSSETELHLLKELGIKTPNTYSNFLEICCKLLDNDGELVAIIPRSFCNGTRFTKFRKNLLENVRIASIHLFESRKKVFKEYGILQEVIIIKFTKKNIRKVKVSISDTLENNQVDKFPINKIIFDNDPYKFIHIPDKVTDEETLNKIYNLPSSLKELGLNISTGKVVEYREKDLIKDNRNSPAAAFVIYQNYLENDELNLKKELDKKLFLNFTPKSVNKMIPAGNYIIIKRMSYKEKKNRLTTAILKDSDFEHERMTVENHLNYIHHNDGGIDINLAIGLNAFFNTKTLDNYIRRFSGHTQINASDILSIPMPSRDKLIQIGKKVQNEIINNEDIEKLIY